MVAAAGVAASGEAALAIGVHALAPLLADEGEAAVLAVAQRLPIALGRRLLAAADLAADGAVGGGMGRIVSGTGRVVPAAALDARDERGGAAGRRHAPTPTRSARARPPTATRPCARDTRRGARRPPPRWPRCWPKRALTPARLREAATPAAIALATKMAEQIIGRAVTVAPEVMADIVGAALDACRPRGDWVRVRVHPDDAAAVIARRDALAGRAPTGGGAGDRRRRIASGAMAASSRPRVGRVDARLETQLDALERALTEQTHG